MGILEWFNAGRKSREIFLCAPSLKKILRMPMIRSEVVGDPNELSVSIDITRVFLNVYKYGIGVTLLICPFLGSLETVLNVFHL